MLIVNYYCLLYLHGEATVRVHLLQLAWVR